MHAHRYGPVAHYRQPPAAALTLRCHQSLLCQPPGHQPLAHLPVAHLSCASTQGQHHCQQGGVPAHASTTHQHQQPPGLQQHNTGQQETAAAGAAGQCNKESVMLRDSRPAYIDPMSV
jgi:hypothetical protein